MHKTFVARFTEALLYATLAVGGLIWIALPFNLNRLLIFFVDAYIVDPFYHSFVLIFLMASGVFCLLIVWELLRLFRTLRVDPFVERNVKALKRMGIFALALVLLFAVKCVVYFTPMTLVCAFVILLLGLFALVLSGLFAKAVEYKRENDLTI